MNVAPFAVPYMPLLVLDARLQRFSLCKMKFFRPITAYLSSNDTLEADNRSVLNTRHSFQVVLFEINFPFHFSHSSDGRSNNSIKGKTKTNSAVTFVRLKETRRGCLILN